VTVEETASAAGDEVVREVERLRAERDAVRELLRSLARVAARLSTHADGRQMLIGPRIHAAVEEAV